MSEGGMAEPVHRIEDVHVERTANGHKDSKEKKHKKEKRHKEDKHKKHKRDKHLKADKEEPGSSKAAVSDHPALVNGKTAPVVDDKTTDRKGSARAGTDSEPESGEIPVVVENRVAGEVASGPPPSSGVAAARDGGSKEVEVDGQPRADGARSAEAKRSSGHKEHKRKREADSPSLTALEKPKGSEREGHRERAQKQVERRHSSKETGNGHAAEDLNLRPSKERADGRPGEAAKQHAEEPSKAHRDRSHRRSHSPGRDGKRVRDSHDAGHRGPSPHHSHGGRGNARRSPDARGRRGDHGRDLQRGSSPLRNGRLNGYDRHADMRREDRLQRDRRKDDGRRVGQDRYGRGQDERYNRHMSPQRYRGREPDRSRDRRPRSRSRDRGGRERQADEKLQDIVEAATTVDSEGEEERLIAERRVRRQQILAKHQKQKDAADAVVAPTATELAGRAPAAEAASASAALSPKPSEVESVPGTPLSDDGSGLSDIKQEGDLWQTRSGSMPAAAPGQDGADSQGESSEEKHKVENQGKKAHIDVDMFADEPESEVPEVFKGSPGDGPVIPVAQRRLQDNFDDPEGYYNFQVGEIMDNRYEVYATHGKGVFSSVLRARDMGKITSAGVPMEVAIKVIRANDIMTKAGQTETVILRKLGGADPEGKRHVIRLLRTFEYRSHLCLVFESMDINLRELTKKYGRGIGLNVKAVQAFASQLLWSLYHLRSCGVLHADVKPDNILVNHTRNIIKVCDFGSAMFTGDNEITPYLVSRFYRSPEVILGLKYDHPMDMWSIGCVLYELFTGKILFPGKTNNEMLKLMMDVKGPFPKKMLKKAAFADKHFENDPNMSFALMEEDPLTRRPIRRVIANPTIKHDFTALLAGSEGEKRKVTQLADLLERMMHLDPDKRILPKDALRHPFIKEK